PHSLMVLRYRQNRYVQRRSTNSDMKLRSYNDLVGRNLIDKAIRISTELRHTTRNTEHLCRKCGISHRVSARAIDQESAKSKLADGYCTSIQEQPYLRSIQS